MDDELNHRGNSRRWIVQEIENSLRRLGTDWIDLYQIHRPDPTTDIDETVGALTDLVQQGKVRYIGSSSFSAGADRRRTVDGARAAPRALPHRASPL
jgi:aryl-alcohol dehydrogenase-like predicted oxidoreductase